MISLFGSPFTKNIRSNKDHDIHLEINVKKDKLYISCHYYVKYFITKFEKEFSLEELISQSDYYKQFQNVGQILGEIRNNSSDTKRNIKEEIEELDDPKKIKVIIYLNSKLYKSLSYVLDKREKTEKEILEEYKSIIKIYENKSPINGFGNSKIITDKTKLFLKAWISPLYNVQANLLYSFNLTYPKKFEDSFWSGRNFTILEKVKEFHDNCDNINSILVICKSGSQIFGGYTSLSFDSSNTYKYDNDSFLFSINHEKKYPKNNFKENESIWGYKNFGPCFYYDLQFVENTMNKVTSEMKNYLIPKDFIDNKKAIKYGNDIFLEVLEIYKITIYDEK